MFSVIIPGGRTARLTATAIAQLLSLPVAALPLLPCRHCPPAVTALSSLPGRRWHKCFERLFSRSVVLANADVLLPSTSAALCRGLKLSVCAVTTAVLGWKISLDLRSTEFIGKRSQRLVTRAVALA